MLIIKSFKWPKCNCSLRETEQLLPQATYCTVFCSNSRNHTSNFLITPLRSAVDLHSDVCPSQSGLPRPTAGHPVPLWTLEIFISMRPGVLMESGGVTHEVVYRYPVHNRGPTPPLI